MHFFSIDFFLVANSSKVFLVKRFPIVLSLGDSTKYLHDPALFNF